MGKYDMKNQKNTSSLPVWVIGGCVILVAVLIVVIGLLRNGTPIDTPDPTNSTPAVTTTPTVTTQPTVPPTTEPVADDVIARLNGDLSVIHIGKYAGIYMEDGSDEVVSDLMMLVLRNDGTQDLQLARISLHYSDYTAQFEVTNLPAGESVVLLEKNRLPYDSADFLSAEVANVVHFPTPMSMMEDQFEITGGDGYLDVTNISDSDISGEIFIYYKNSATDLLYGGITYRARISNGIRAGETVRVTTNHYYADACRLLMVTYSE